MTKFEVLKFKLIRFAEKRFFRLWRLQCDMGLGYCWIAEVAFYFYSVCDRRNSSDPIHNWFEWLLLGHSRRR